jgi:uncharacterized protein (DUF1800 family)
LDPARSIADVNAEHKAINAMPDGPDKDAARKALNERGNRLAYEAVRSELLRATYSPDQLKEEMVWFWLNHFSVHQAKANLRWLVADYADRAIRPHALGRFKDLVLATLEHPAMLAYLDNNQNAAGHVNENYARELMELHTLGVNAGYTQRDVQQLALVLTGSGINAGDPPKLKPEWREALPARRRIRVQSGAPRLRHQGAARSHHPGSRIRRGRRGRDAGSSSSPLCAHFISRELATYFVADNPPPQLVERMAKTFQRTDGDIAAVLREMLLSPELDAALGGKIQGSDALRHIGRALRLRRAHDHQHAPLAQLAERSRRAPLRARNARRLSAHEARGRARAR